jgi:hypothetical protein
MSDNNNDNQINDMEIVAPVAEPAEMAAPVTGIVEDAAAVEAEEAEAAEVAAPVTGVAEGDDEDEEEDELIPVPRPVACEEELTTTDEEEDDEDDEDDEAEAEATETSGLRHRICPPMPTSPLRRQVGASLSPVLGSEQPGIELVEELEGIRLVEAGPVEVPGVTVPVWIFLSGLAVMTVYLTLVAYLLSWHCGVQSR